MQGDKLRRILWLSWKDLSHPQAGGAEVVKEQIARRLAKAGYEIVILTSGFNGARSKEERDGYKIIRVGGRWTVYWAAYRFYKKNLQGWPDLIIDEVNTVPFFAKFYVKEQNILLIHQLARKVWFYQLPLPFGLIGYLLEPIYIWLLRDRNVVTISESTRKELRRFGHRSNHVYIISMGTDIEPVENLFGIIKYGKPTLLSIGSIRPMKRTDHIVRVFEIAKKKIRNLQLIIAGDATGVYGSSVLGLIARSPYMDSITTLGQVSKEKKIELMQKSHVLAVTSIKEGWGLVVTEANSQGTPAVVYDVDGLRDSTIDGKTGVITKCNTPQALADAIVDMLSNHSHYSRLREAAWKASREITFEKSAQDLMEVLEQLG